MLYTSNRKEALYEVLSERSRIPESLPEEVLHVLWAKCVVIFQVPFRFDKE